MKDVSDLCIKEKKPIFLFKIHYIKRTNILDNNIYT